MGNHHYTDLVCNDCKEYAGDTFQSCKVCECSRCGDCLTAISGTEEQIADRLGYDVCEEDEDAKDEDTGVMKYYVRVCYPCEKKFECMCGVCSDPTPETRDKTCSTCNGYVCKDCNILDTNNKVMCWNCVKEDRMFISFLLLKSGYHNKQDAMEEYIRPKSSSSSSTAKPAAKKRKSKK